MHRVWWFFSYLWTKREQIKLFAEVVIAITALAALATLWFSCQAFEVSNETLRISHEALENNRVEVQALQKSVELEWRPFLDITCDILPDIKQEVFTSLVNADNSARIGTTSTELIKLLKRNKQYIDSIRISFIASFRARNLGHTPALIDSFKLNYFSNVEWEQIYKGNLANLYFNPYKLDNDLVVQTDHPRPFGKLTVEQTLSLNRFLEITENNQFDTIYLSCALKYRDFFGHQYNSFLVMYLPLHLLQVNGSVLFSENPAAIYIERYRWDIDLSN